MKLMTFDASNNMYFIQNIINNVEYFQLPIIVRQILEKVYAVYDNCCLLVLIIVCDLISYRFSGNERVILIVLLITFVSMLIILNLANNERTCYTLLVLLITRLYFEISLTQGACLFKEGIIYVFWAKDHF